MTADDDATDTPGPNRWLGLVTASLGMFLCSLDMTVNVALPDITRSFGTTSHMVQWIIIFYVGSSTGLQLSLGNAADRYGLKRFYLLGLAIYSLAVLLIGLSPQLSIVFAFRVLQAVGNGLIMVSAPALVTALFPSESRGKALGIMTGLATLGMVVGAWGGGFLVDHFGWRSIFLGRAPLGALIALLSIFSLREVVHQRQHAYDLRGAITLFIGLASFILFLSLGGRTGWTTSYALGLLALTILSLMLFVWAENTSPEPVFDLSMLTHRVIAPLVLAAFLMNLAIFVNWFILPFYVADTLKVDAKTLGFLLMLMPVLGTGASPLGGWLSDRMPPAYLTTISLVIIAGAMYWFTHLHESSTVFDVTLRMIAVGLGMGLFQAANATLIMGSVPGDKLGTGGALLAMSRSMGTVSSVALMGALFASRLAVHTAVAADPNHNQAFILAFKDTYWVSTCLAALAIIVSFMYWPRRIDKL